MNAITPRLASSNVDAYVECLRDRATKVEDSTRTVEYKNGYRYATNVAIFRIVEMWEMAVKSALAINEMLAEEGKLDEDLDDAFATAQAIANSRKSKTTD